MYRIDNATSDGSLPSPTAAGPNPDSYFTKGNPGMGVPATIVDDEWLNMLQEEICNAIEDAGDTLDKSDRNQLSTAIRKNAGGNYIHTQGSASNSWSITHNLGTKNVTVECYDDATDKTIIPDEITRTSANQITITWGANQDGIALIHALE